MAGEDSFAGGSCQASAGHEGRRLPGAFRSTEAINQDPDDPSRSGSAADNV